MAGKSPLTAALELWPGTIEELAEALGVRRNTLYVYASGRRAAPAELLREVARLLEERTEADAARARAVARALRAAAHDRE